MLKFVSRGLNLAPMALALGALVSVGTNGSASVVSGDLAGRGNSALTFDPLTPTPVIVRFTDANLFAAQAYQLGFRTNNGFVFDVTNVMYSFDNLDYYGFDAGILGVGVGSAIVSNPEFLGSADVARTIYFSYELPAGLEEGSVTQVILMANSDGETTGGLLTNDIGNNYVRLTRTHLAVSTPIAPNVVPEPTTFTIAAIGFGLAGFGRLRNRISRRTN
jgi:hypothetical protein